MKTAKTKLVEIWGGFHNQMTPIRVRVPKDWTKREQGIHEVVSEATYKRINRHLCGYKDCMCGGVLRAEIIDV
jgi:hypothetical protein